MDLQEKNDQLSNMIDSLGTIIWDLDSKEMHDYIMELTDTKLRAEEDLKEIEERLSKQYRREEIGQENEYWRSVL